MLAWNEVKDEFAWEGSWRDICVPNTSVPVWQNVIDALLAAGFDGHFEPGPTESSLQNVAGLLRDHVEHGSLWQVSSNGVSLVCHFFDPSEIEFDLDPREIRGQHELDGVLQFMRVIAGAAGSAALLTPENMHEMPFVKVEPSGRTEHIPTDGFFRNLARR